MAYQITHIRKPISGQHQHITHCRILDLGREESVGQIIKWIRAGEQFYITDPISKKTAYVGVFESKIHPPYLRTYADDLWTNNLLSLPNLGADQGRGI